jgi:KaiC/GvpD/RAD55 family RecA-like ATPase
MSAEAIWILAEPLSGEHIAQLYSHETVLVESLRMFTTHGLTRGEAVLLVLVSSHRDLLLRHLKADGVDVDGLQRDGQLLLLDASELLASFMLDGMPDKTLFGISVGEVVERMTSGGNRKVRVFGEMVDLLWKSNQPGAIRLEQMWNELIEGSDLSVFCAYSTNYVYETFPEALRTPHLLEPRRRAAVWVRAGRSDWTAKLDADASWTE